MLSPNDNNGCQNDTITLDSIASYMNGSYKNILDLNLS